MEPNNTQNYVSTCPVCRAKTAPDFVHGHYQCPVCHQIVVACCEGSGYEPADPNSSDKKRPRSKQLGLKFKNK